MEIFRLEKVIENEKLDLEMAITLKLDHQYIEERIEDFFPSSSLDEANNAIKELLEKNGSL